MFRKFIAAFALIFFLSSTAFAADDSKVLRVTGAGLPPANWNPQDSFAKTFARQAARMDALRQLAENLDGVTVDAETVWNDETKTIERDRIKTEFIHNSKVFKLLEKNARQVGEAIFLEGGGCLVDMELILPADWTPTEISQK